VTFKSQAVSFSSYHFFRWSLKAITMLYMIVFINESFAGVNAVRMSNQFDTARVVFDLEERSRYTVSKLENPARIVVDFSHKISGNLADFPIKKNCFVRGFRHGLHGSKSERFVFEVRGRSKLVSFLLEPTGEIGYRLVVDIRSSEILLSGKDPSLEGTANKPAKSKKIIVAIDAGHGGRDVGAIGASGTYEKDINLAVAEELANLVKGNSSMNVVLTRRGNSYVKLRRRLAVARNHKADVFVSLHADAFKDPQVKGSSVYILSRDGADGEAARWLADKANKEQLVGGISLDNKDSLLSSVLIDLSQAASIKASTLLGDAVLKELVKIGPLHKKTVQKAAFVVLKSPDIPSILIEMAFISNPLEEKRLTNAKYQKDLALAIYEGIVNYSSGGDSEKTGMIFRTHKVIRGDNLSDLGNRYSVSISDLKEMNNLDSNLLFVGDTLKIPTLSGRSFREHRIVRGDTLSDLGVRYGVSVMGLKDFNGLRTEKVYVGDIIRIPW
jgi:N-acetylmuramoyl-L-alanine amidase